MDTARLAATARNILLLEQKRGHDDRAVVGGLARFLGSTAAALGIAPELTARLADYATASLPERAATVAELLAALGTPSAQPSFAIPRPRDEHRDPGGAVASSWSGESDSAFSRDAREPRRASPPAREDGEKGGATGLGKRRGSSDSKQLRPDYAPPGEAPSGSGSARPPRAKRRPDPSLAADTSVAKLPGVGPTRARRLAALGITTVGDLRFHFPHRYIPYPPPQPAAQIGFQHLASFEGTVRRVDVAPLPGKRVRITAILGDQTGAIAAVWIRAGGVPSGIEQGARLAVSGPLVTHGRQAYFENPEFEPARLPPLNTRRIVPVYPLTAGLTQSFMRSLTRRALESLPPLDEILPARVVAAAGLLDRQAAIEEIHEPSSLERAAQARRRFAFEEMIPLQLLVLQRRLAYQSRPTVRIAVPWGLLAEFRQSLPFSLTAAQQRVLSTILEDLSRAQAMIRLLQGEVGSGKTVVAALALLTAVTNGGQGALVAPTEILAEQHFRTLSSLYERARPAIERTLGRPLTMALLRGSLTKSERDRSRAMIASGEADIVVGTHAVIESDVEFARLALAVVDEQHRFGVSQRVALRRKGENPHLLVMTATPIPRTLALSLYGDLDLSIIDELPLGRKPVETVLLRPQDRAEAYRRIREAAKTGHQAFVICPLVEGSPAMEARAATTEFEELRRGALAGLRLALLHGRMRSADKDRVMQEFAAGEYDVLVATTVVEVGVDVPNATVMVIEGAERFGLAQLHQLRGRVGRGSAEAICYLLAETNAPESLERLEAVARSHNGLELAEEDLRIRGPGDYYGMRQSGFPPLRIARLEDLEFVQQARALAEQILEVDPNLERPEHQALADAVRALGDYGGEAN